MEVSPSADAKEGASKREGNNPKNGLKFIHDLLSIDYGNIMEKTLKIGKKPSLTMV